MPTFWHKNARKTAPSNDECSAKGLHNKWRTPEYVILMLHERPEFGAGTEFLSTYHARESKDEQCIKEVFVKAFTIANPSWIIKKVIVKVISPNISNLGIT